eukprot:g16717.t1
MTAPIIPKVGSALDTSKFPTHKETPLPQWQNLGRSMDRIRYENFDFTKCVAPNVASVAANVMHQTNLPTLLNSNPKSNSEKMLAQGAGANANFSHAPSPTKRTNSYQSI